VIHAIVLIGAEGAALGSLGGELAGIEGVAEALAVVCRVPRVVEV